MARTAGSCWGKEQPLHQTSRLFVVLEGGEAEAALQGRRSQNQLRVASYCLVEIPSRPVAGVEQQWCEARAEDAFGLLYWGWAGGEPGVTQDVPALLSYLTFLLFTLTVTSYSPF